MASAVTAVQVLSLLIFIYSAVTINLRAVMALLAFVVCIFLQRGKTKDKELNITKGQHHKLADMSLEERQRLYQQVYEYTTYDASSAESLTRFNVIRNNTQCLFAKTSRLWGSLPWRHNLSFEDNIERILPTFHAFTCLSDVVKLDGFVIELPGDKYGYTTQHFSEAVCHTLTILSNNDKARVHCMNHSWIDKLGWVFEFNRVSMFVTSFAPCYPRSHSRFSFGSQHAYVLFQPEVSFLRHDIGVETPSTNWEDPKTVRDRIRCAFRDAGRPYHVPVTVPASPVAFEVVKGIIDDGQHVVEWWRHRHSLKGRTVIASLDEDLKME